MKSPVLFIIFKREDTTRRVFERICEAQPPRLYIAADGPRKDRTDEAEKCMATRKVVEEIDWPCEVHKLFREENLGCGKGVSSAITWFFDHEEQGIIIEDDILPHIDFFRYCDEMLERYKDDDRIQMIAGSNEFYNDYKTENSYYLSRYFHIWGWASWRRVWKTYEFDTNKLPQQLYMENLNKLLPKKSAKYFEHVFRTMQNYKNDTWDYQLYFNQVIFGRYTITNYRNMVQNIGILDEGASHPTSVSRHIRKLLNRNVESPYPINHPKLLSEDYDADIVTMKNSRVYIAPFYMRTLYKIWTVLRRIIK